MHRNQDYCVMIVLFINIYCLCEINNLLSLWDLLLAFIRFHQLSLICTQRHRQWLNGSYSYLKPWNSKIRCHDLLLTYR